MSGEKIRVHRTGIPLEEITFSPRVAPADGVWRAVQACRLIAKKGLATTLRAFARFAQAFPKARLTLAGEGPQRDELRSLAEQLGISAQVEFPGFLSQPDLRALYAGAHFFLHPSEVAADGNQEGVPNSMLEAMAAGLPILATRHGGIPEAVVHGRSGLLVAERDHEALAEAMISLARDPERFAAMSVEAHAQVSREFAGAAQARQLESFYREAMALFAAR